MDQWKILKITSLLDWTLGLIQFFLISFSLVYLLSSIVGLRGWTLTGQIGEFDVDNNNKLLHPSTNTAIGIRQIIYNHNSIYSCLLLVNCISAYICSASAKFYYFCSQYHHFYKILVCKNSFRRSSLRLRLSWTLELIIHWTISGIWPYSIGLQIYLMTRIFTLMMTKGLQRF